jgi:hypothetical protein
VDESGWLGGSKWMDIQLDPSPSNPFTSLMSMLSEVTQFGLLRSTDLNSLCPPNFEGDGCVYILSSTRITKSREKTVPLISGIT